MKIGTMKWWMGPSLVSLWLGISGCAMNDTPAADAFAGSGDASRRIMEVQQAVGARNDGMLRSQHFDGAMLSGLGRDKLDLMLKDNSKSLPVVVYLDLPAAEALTRDRRESIVFYLKEKGLLETQVFVEGGPNPNSVTPAAAGMARLSKTESNTAEASSATGAAGSGATSNSNTGSANADSK